jgi:hypothetical protein
MEKLTIFDTGGDVLSLPQAAAAATAAAIESVTIRFRMSEFPRRGCRGFGVAHATSF